VSTKSNGWEVADKITTKMIRKDILDRAKAYLCWDIFTDLSIQMVELQEAVSYFYPPSDHQTIVVFYERGNPDFSVSLFLLFHEAGHCLQLQEMMENGRELDFWKKIHLPTGTDRENFERESWAKGKNLLREFIIKHDLSMDIIHAYEKQAARSLKTYR